MRSPLRPALLAGVLLLPACGGGGDVPTLDAAVAEDLAGRADVLADQLEAGDACGARDTAGTLVTVTSDARDNGEVPVEIAGEVIATARDLVRDVTCEPPAPPAPVVEDDDDDAGEDEDRGGQGERKGDDKEDDKEDGKGEGKAKGKDD